MLISHTKKVTSLIEMKTDVFLRLVMTPFQTFRPSNLLQRSFRISGSETPDYATVTNLAAMSYNVYMDDTNKWYYMRPNKTTDMRVDNNTVKAFLYSNDDFSFNVVAIKGTSVYWNTNTVYNDKLNDNLFFSCCFYKQSRMFPHCNGSGPTSPTKMSCDTGCYRDTKEMELNYFNIGIRIVEALKHVIRLDNSTVMFTGHSLGGAVSTLLGLTYNKTTVTFQSPGERHYLQLAGIRYDEQAAQKVFHFGHNADVIFTGKCNGMLSWCYLAGYNIYTKCHVGHVCEYDAVGILNMKESIFTHRLKFVIDRVMSAWNGVLPKCDFQTNCSDCEGWTYF